MIGDPAWTRRERWALLALVACAILLRWFHVWRMGDSPFFHQPTMDPAFHLEWAQSFAAGERFQPGPYFRAPLYPWILGILVTLFDEAWGPRLIQGVFGGATTALVVLIARQAFGRVSAWIAGGLAASSWVLIYFDGELLIPTLYVPLLLSGLYACQRLDLARERRALLGWAVGAGLFMGLAAIARPNVLLFVPLLGFWIWRRPEAWDIGASLAFAFSVMLPILPISIHNRVVGGEWVMISSQAGVNLWIGNNPDSDGSTAIVPGTPGGWWEGFHAARELARAEAGEELSDAGISRHYSKKVMAWAWDEPLAFLSHQFWKLRLFWTDWELGNNQEIRFFARHFNPLARISMPFSVLVGLGLAGVVLAVREGARRHFPLWGFLTVYMVSVVVFFVCSRFRVPILPPLMVFTGHACARVVECVRGRRFGALAVILLPAFAGFVASRSLPAGLVSSEANGLAQLALAEADAGQHQEAVDLLEQALPLAPRHRYLRGWLANSLVAVGERDRAMRLFEETLEDYPDQPEALAGWLEGAFQLSRYAEVIGRARAALKRNPGLSEVHYHLGRSLYLQGDYAGALEAFRESRRQNPLGFSAPYAAGKLLLEVYDDRKGALAAFKAAVQNRDRGEEVFVRQAEELIETLRDL